ncbi:MAG: bifunctional diaminohydroxyphosphoribosylaminopyrimidine deaminase/5-amino-6-(5-phosphoribosylamino)uracil reductase RibD [Deltaproteobacteria bacterium]|nr:bifunctional diaminohydroxyphosphoribosylaminopyrimidine deaminase/5-amino-6-(5-phosphoribosylamino)uracil reductase RibD [Deltaproteobacteria bacterium]
MPTRLTPNKDERFMQLALLHASKALGRTTPNPAVGAVVVKGTRVVATGYHRRAGKPHAEAEALRAAGSAAQGSTLYVTLEPCCHTGRTGPCTDAVIAAKVARVVVGCRDANPVVNGAGIARLRRAGIRVDVGCLQDECTAINRAFFCWIEHQRPLVTLKYAATLDGVIGQENAEVGKGRAPLAITSKAALAYAHGLRAQHHAILVGHGTVLADDPQLTVRAKRLPPGGSHAILRVVLDTHLRTPPSARLLAKAEGVPPPLLLAAEPEKAARAAFARRRRALEAAGAEVALVPPGTHGVALGPAVRVLAKRGVQSLLVEGGSHVHAAFVAAGLVDRVAAFFAPKLAGGGVPVVTGRGLGTDALLPLSNLQFTPLGPDLLVTADVAPAGRRRK